MSGGSGGGTQTTIQELNSIEKGPISRLYGEAENQFAQGPDQYYPDNTVAQPTDNTINAEANALRYASGLGTDIMNIGGDALKRGLRSPYEVFNDPGLQASFGTAVQPIDDMLQRNLFNINSASLKTGNKGGARQGVVESLAFNDARNSATDAFNKLYGGAYADQMRTQGLNLTNLSQIQGGLGYGDSLQSQIGDLERQRQQDLINEKIARYEYQQSAPYNNLVNFNNLVNTSRLPTTATQFASDQQTGGGQIAGAASGAAIGNMLFPGGPGAAGGAALGYYLG